MVIGLKKVHSKVQCTFHPFRCPVNYTIAFIWGHLFKADETRYYYNIFRRLKTDAEVRLDKRYFIQIDWPTSWTSPPTPSCLNFLLCHFWAFLFKTLILLFHSALVHFEAFWNYNFRLARVKRQIANKEQMPRGTLKMHIPLKYSFHCKSTFHWKCIENLQWSTICLGYQRQKFQEKMFKLLEIDSVRPGGIDTPSFYSVSLKLTKYFC